MPVCSPLIKYPLPFSAASAVLANKISIASQPGNPGHQFSLINVGTLDVISRAISDSNFAVCQSGVKCSSY